MIHQGRGGEVMVLESGVYSAWGGIFEPNVLFSTISIFCTKRWVSVKKKKRWLIVPMVLNSVCLSKKPITCNLIYYMVYVCKKNCKFILPNCTKSFVLFCFLTRNKDERKQDIEKSIMFDISLKSCTSGRIWQKKKNTKGLQKQLWK